MYLDNAATSFPKPDSVYDAVERFNRHLGAAVGRGTFRQATEVQTAVNRCRKLSAEILGAESPDRIIFTFNGTDSLNLAIHGALQAGDHVVTSSVEHNSVLRPLRELQSRGLIEVTVVEGDSVGWVDPGRVRDALRPNTRLVAMIHASNVSGTILPVADIGEVARNAGAMFLIDAAQTAGHVPINVQALPVDLLACPGHKGLLGPLGTGLLYVRPGIEERLRTLRQGGTGSQSEDDHQPELLPDKYEAGNHNAPGLLGLEAALAFLQAETVKSIRSNESELTSRLIAGFRETKGLKLAGRPSDDQRVGVVSVIVEGMEPQTVSAILDENFDIQTRAGLHCAPGVHRCMGTFGQGGTVRLSLGHFNTAADIDTVLSALKTIVEAV